MTKIVYKAVIHVFFLINNRLRQTATLQLQKRAHKRFLPLFVSYVCTLHIHMENSVGVKQLNFLLCTAWTHSGTDTLLTSPPALRQLLDIPFPDPSDFILTGPSEIKLAVSVVFFVLAPVSFLVGLWGEDKEPTTSILPAPSSRRKCGFLCHRSLLQVEPVYLSL